MTGTTTTRTLTIAAAATAAALALGTGVAGAASVEPTVVDGNPSCADVAPGSTELKYDSGQAGVVQLTDGDITVTLDVADDGVVDWTSSHDVAAVILKGGPLANVYLYPGDSDLADTGLVPADNPNNDEAFGLSHVSVCVPPETPPEETTTTTAPEVTTTTVPDVTTTVPEVTTTVPDEEVLPTTVVQPEPQPEPVTEVLGQQQERSALPRTGTGLTLLAAAGASLVALGGAARRTAARRAA